MTSKGHYTIYTSSAIKMLSGNDEHTQFIGVWIYEGEKEIQRISKTIGYGGNDEAQYKAIYNGLSALNKLKTTPKSISILTDSQLVARQITGQYQVKSEWLKLLYEVLEELIDSMTITEFSCEWISKKKKVKGNVLSKKTS